MEDIRIVTMMVIELVVNMERVQYRQVDVDNLLESFIASLTELDIGLTGEVRKLKVCFRKINGNSNGPHESSYSVKTVRLF